MRRRAFLAATGAAFGGSVAGCLSGDTGQGTAEPTSTPTESGRDGLSIGEATTVNGAEVVVDDATVARRVVGENDHLEPRDGVYLLAHVSATNALSDPIDLPTYSAFSALVGSDQFDSVRIRGPITHPAEGDSYAGESEAHPDVTTSGWLAFPLPQEFGTPTLACSFSRMYGDGPSSAYWSFPVDRDQAARLSVDVDGPESIQWGDDVEYTVSVENTGGREGYVIHQAAFSHPESYTLPDEEESIRVPPGETVEQSFATTPEDFSALEFRFHGESYPIEVTPARAQLGETITSPGGVDFWVGNLSVASHYLLDGDEERTFAESDRQFSFVNYRAENTTEGRQTGFTDVAAHADGDSFDVEAVGTFGTPVLEEPVGGPFLYPATSLGGGNDESGWVVHDVDGGVRENDLTIRGVIGDETVAIWE